MNGHLDQTQILKIEEIQDSNLKADLIIGDIFGFSGINSEYVNDLINIRDRFLK